MHYTLDLEVYPNYFLAMVVSERNDVLTFECWKSRNQLSKFTSWINQLDKLDRIYTWNGWYYDFLLMQRIMEGKLNTAEEVYEYSKNVIHARRSADSFQERASLDVFPFVAIDLMELWNLRQSLKKTAAYIGYPKIQDLPIDPHKSLDAKERKLIRTYCLNDIRATMAIAEISEDELGVRRGLIDKYELAPENITLGRPRIAKATIQKLWYDRYEDFPRKPQIDEIPTEYRFARKLDPRIKFKTPECRAALAAVKAFSRKPDGTPFKHTVRLADRDYTLGEGGLHDDFGTRVLQANRRTKLLDIDVSSYYPTLMLNLGLTPSHLPGIDEMIRSVVEDRLKAKKEGDKVTSDALKIVINSMYGMMGNKYSFFFDPMAKLGVCLNGQLYLLMLIERLHLAGVETVYANTDGIVAMTRSKAELKLTHDIVHRWNRIFKLKTDIESWDEMYCLNTNDYFWVKGEGALMEVKGKKTFATSAGVANRLNAPAIPRTVMGVLTHGIDPLEALESYPLEWFCYVVAPTKRYLQNRMDFDGAIGGQLPKTIRYFHSVDGGRLYKYNTNTGGEIMYPDANSCRVVLDLESEPWGDCTPVNYGWYLAEIDKVLETFNSVKVNTIA